MDDTLDEQVVIVVIATSLPFFQKLPRSNLFGSEMGPMKFDESDNFLQAPAIL